jgi:hypothetical protein
VTARQQGQGQAAEGEEVQGAAKQADREEEEEGSCGGR